MRVIPHELHVHAEVMSSANFSAQDINKNMTAHAFRLGLEVTWNYQDIFHAYVEPRGPIQVLRSVLDKTTSVRVCTRTP
jgi:hypothetical protein